MLHYGVIWLTILVALLGAYFQLPWLLACATFLVGARYAVIDIARLRDYGITPVALAGTAVAIFGFADVVGLRSIVRDVNSPYDIYAAHEHLLLAATIALVGWSCLIVGIRFAVRRSALFSLLPAVRGHISDRALLAGGTLLALVSIGANFLPTKPQIGTVFSLFLLAPHLVAFCLARAAFARRLRHAAALALTITLLASARAFLFDYLRSAALLPFVAFGLGAWLGSRSVKPFRSKYFVPVYLAGVLFILLFRAFGDVRAADVTYVERIAAVYERQTALRNSNEDQAPALLRRLTTFNQLSQVGQLVEEGGYLGGSTLQYLGYAFIPRFLWHDKPTIAKGAWFAVQIGQGRQLPDGSFTNSVNMTVPGELYLNFGWTGVVFGTLGFGVLLGVLWITTRFWEDPRNTAGTAFGFYLLWTGLGLGADLQVIVTLLAMYLLFSGGSVGLRLLHAGRVRRPRVLREVLHYDSAGMQQNDIQ